MIKRAVISAIGVVLMLGYWTVKDKLQSSAGDDTGKGKIPAKIWEGGSKVTIVSNATDPGTVSVTFETNLQVDDPKHRFVETWEKVPAGPHSVTIDVPPNVVSSVERSSENPKPGSTVEISVQVNGNVAARDSMSLSEPLQQGYGFAAQLHLADLATGNVSESN